MNDVYSGLDPRVGVSSQDWVVDDDIADEKRSCSSGSSTPCSPTPSGSQHSYGSFNTIQVGRLDGLAVRGGDFPPDAGSIRAIPLLLHVGINNMRYCGIEFYLSYFTNKVN